MAEYDFNRLTTFRPNARKKARYDKVRDALAGKLSNKTRARLRKEYKGLKLYMDPTDPSTGGSLRDLESSARDETRSTFEGSFDEVGNAIRAQEQRVADLDPWFNQYRTHLTTLGQNQATAAGAQANEMAAQAGKLQNQDVAQQAQLASRAAGNPYADAALQSSKDASAGRAALAAGNAASVKERGAIGQGMYGSFAANSGLEQSRQKAIAVAKGDEARKEKSKLSQKAGQYFSERLDAGRANVLDSETKRAAAKLAGLKLGETSSHNRAMESTAQQNADSTETRTNWAVDPDNPDNQEKPPKAKTKYRYTQLQRVSMRDDARSVYDSAQAAIVKKKLTKGKYAGKKVRGLQLEKNKDGTPGKWVALTPENEQHLRQILNNKKIKNATLRVALAQQLIYGDVGANTYNAVRRLGINPKNVGLKPRKR